MKHSSFLAWLPIVMSIQWIGCSSNDPHMMNSGGGGSCPNASSSSDCSASSSEFVNSTSSSGSESSTGSSSSSTGGTCIPSNRVDACNDFECGLALDRCGGLYSCVADTFCSTIQGDVCLYGKSTPGRCAPQDACIQIPEYDGYCKMPGYSFFACNNSFGPVLERNCAPGTGPTNCLSYPGPKLPFLEQPQARAACCIPCADS